MAKLNKPFDPNAAPDMDLDTDLLPNGWYTMRVDATGIRETNAGNGHFIELEMTVIKGPFETRKIWERINHDNPNPKAVLRAEAKLKKICLYAGITGQLEDTDQLRGKVLDVKIGMEKGKPKNDGSGESWGDRNRAKDYRDAGADYAAINKASADGFSGGFDDDDIPF